jgi:hypothetical protein
MIVYGISWNEFKTFKLKPAFQGVVEQFPVRFGGFILIEVPWGEYGGPQRQILGVEPGGKAYKTKAMEKNDSDMNK